MEEGSSPKHELRLCKLRLLMAENPSQPHFTHVTRDHFVGVCFQWDEHQAGTSVPSRKMASAAFTTISDSPRMMSENRVSAQFARFLTGGSCMA